MRSCLIADALAERGAAVTWWASTLDHKTKTFIAEPGHVDRSRPGVEIRLLHGRPFTKNISLQRLLHQQDVARDFLRSAAGVQPPDLIFASVPTLELAEAAIAFATRLGVPCFVDVRDLWPEVFLDVSPLPRLLTRIFIEPLFRQARRVLSHATGVVSLSPAYLDKALALAGRERRPLDRVVDLGYQRSRFSDDELQSAVERWRSFGLRLDGSEDILCYFGELSKTPGFDAVLDGVAMLDQSLRRRLKVVICGQGLRLEELRARAANGVPELLIPGFVNGPSIATLMRAAKAGLLLYPDWSNFTLHHVNKVGEYLSAGLPILSSLGGETKQLLDEQSCGIYVASNAAGWADGLGALLTDERAYELMRDNASRVYAEIFDAQNIYQDLARHLIDCIRLAAERTVARTIEGAAAARSPAGQGDR